MKTAVSILLYLILLASSSALVVLSLGVNSWRSYAGLSAVVVVNGSICALDWRARAETRRTIDDADTQ